MCRVDDCDGYAQVFGDSTLTAKKEHKCDECRRVIQPGEKYRRERGVHESEPFTHKTCQHCLVARDWMNATCGGFVYGEIEEELLEHWNEDTDYRTRELAKLIYGMGRNWQARKGGLMPLPTLNR